MSHTFSAVLEETIRFHAAMPDLLQAYAGRWVVFREGRVSSTHATEDDAYTAGLLAYGRDETYIVDRVERKSAVPLTAAFVYG